MISKGLINKARIFAHDQSRKYGAPSVFQIDFCCDRGKELAKKLGANEKVIEISLLLMDCQLGLALNENRLKEHVRMSIEKTNEILEGFPELEREEIDNVVACVSEHHGVNKFYSQESEIVCNADCYKFLSIKGLIGGLTEMRPMEFEALMKLLSNKVDEKWNALSLDICKKELKPQYKVIKSLFEFHK